MSMCLIETTNQRSIQCNTLGRCAVDEMVDIGGSPTSAWSHRDPDPWNEAGGLRWGGHHGFCKILFSTPIDNKTDMFIHVVSSRYAMATTLPPSAPLSWQKKFPQNSETIVVRGPGINACWSPWPTIKHHHHHIKESPCLHCSKSKKWVRLGSYPPSHCNR